KIDGVFAVMDFGQKSEISAEDLRLVKERERLRAEKKWAEADEIRKKLEGRGILLDDTAAGTKWKKALK
ncbi:MAG: cysteine--tRNA ligase, partial [Candidatus Diapherotrites archaeon]|nr:cysteine--tRNA ligase [Candidatus Diapherotrites archaeon]